MSKHALKIITAISFMALTPLGLGLYANAVDPPTLPGKGKAIAEDAVARDTGFADFTAEVKMVLKNRNGVESLRRLHIKVLEVIDDGDKSLIVFDRPRDIDGTALLTFSHKARNDDQWIYLPALKRVKRISSTNRSGPFVGSEFSYEDLIWPEVEKYDCTWLRDESLDGTSTHVIERVPNYKNSGYSRQVVWYDQAELRILKIEFFDRRGDLLKVMTIKGYQQYSDNFWRADEMFMLNIQNGKSTRLLWENYSFDNGLSDRAFRKGRLENVR